ncbi:MAG: FtsW/RodA/SpoVE family cell cycle protein [Planctomycetota bacterium]
MITSFLPRLVILALAGALVAFGLVVQASVSDAMGVDLVTRQLQWCVVAAAAVILLAFVPYSWWVRHAYLVYGGSLFLLALVPVIGVVRNNSRRWLELGVSVQPSELMKFAFIIAMARLLRYRDEGSRAASLLVPGLFFAVPVLMIFAQPDLGTSLLFAPVALAMLFAAGLSVRRTAAILGGGVGFAVIGYAFFLKPYQQARVLSTFFRDRLTDADRLVEGYQLEQALHSVGIGGWWGEGWGAGAQNRMNALPYRHNDFIYSVVCEEWGFVGGLTLVLLMFALLLAIFRVAVATRDPEARLLAVGVGTLIGTQSVVHVGVNLGAVPTTGMTLPFVSAGGTSLLSFAFAIAIVLNLAGRSAFVFASDPVREQMDRLRRLARAR